MRTRSAPNRSSVKIVDLGIVDLAEIFTGGPKTLFTMGPDEVLSTIRFLDVDFQFVNGVDPGPPDSDLSQLAGLLNLSPAGISGCMFEIGPVKSFGWFGYAALPSTNQLQTRSINYVGYWRDTLAMVASGEAYGPELTQAESPMVLSTSAEIQAAIATVDFNHGYPANGPIAGIKAWTANTEYDELDLPFPSPPTTTPRIAIVANGTIWFNSGSAGVSGGSAPNFAAHAGGTVDDGSDIVWTDTEGPPITSGRVHPVAEIWTPLWDPQSA